MITSDSKKRPDVKYFCTIPESYKRDLGICSFMGHVFIYSKTMPPIEVDEKGLGNILESQKNE